MDVDSITDRGGALVEEKEDGGDMLSPLQPYIEALRRELEYQEPRLLIGLVVALAVVVITVGETRRLVSLPPPPSPDVSDKRTVYTCHLLLPPLLFSEAMCASTVASDQLASS